MEKTFSGTLTDGGRTRWPVICPALDLSQTDDNSPPPFLAAGRDCWRAGLDSNHAMVARHRSALHARSLSGSVASGRGFSPSPRATRLSIPSPRKTSWTAPITLGVADRSGVLGRPTVL